MLRTSLLTLLTIMTAAQRLMAADPPPNEKVLPLPGDVFVIDECPAFLIGPAKPTNEKEAPWVWYAPTLPGLPAADEKWMFEKFTAAGISIAGIDVGESYGSPNGRATYSEFYNAMVQRGGMSKKPVLLARSRGGLMLYCWACENADKVGGVAGIYPVCNIASYPGVDRAAGAYELSAEQLEKELPKHNPLDRLAPLAKANVPLFAIHGDADKTVPLEANSGEMANRYASLGGKMELIIPQGQGHNMWRGFFECRELVDFVSKNARPTAK